MKLHELFIDESGQADPRSGQSQLYVLLGCSVEEGKRGDLKTHADQIKFKYWGKTDVIFHSREISRNEGPFSIFHHNKNKKQEFVHDLLDFLKQAHIVVFVIVCDNKIAFQKGWNLVKVVRETGKLLFLHFITWLLGLDSAKGKVFIESATAEKDKYYLETFSYFLSPGNTHLAVPYTKIQEILTSISFVTKRNHDTEEQIADLLTYAAKCKYLRVKRKQTYKIGSYEDRIIKILDEKLWHLPVNARERKMKFYKTIDPFCIVPKT